MNTNEPQTKPLIGQSHSNAGLGLRSHCAAATLRLYFEFVDKKFLNSFFQRFILLCQFRYLVLESRILRFKVSYLLKRNRQLKDRLADAFAHDLFPCDYEINLPSMK